MPVFPEDVVILPGAFEAMKILEGAGFLLFIVSNQGAYAKGKAPLELLVGVARRVDDLIRESGTRVAEAYYSFSHPNGVIDFFSGPSLERKPNPYYLKLAEASYGLDLENSWMVGDRRTDIRCGELAGCKTALITGNHGAVSRGPYADISAPTLLDAAKIMVSS